MNQQIITWFEILFDISYLVAVWWMVALMTKKMYMVAENEQKVARFVRLAFILLAAGDTGHVGFRAAAALAGNINAEVNVFGSQMTLTGIGMLTTAVTVTFFYMVMVYVWKERYQQKHSWFTYTLLATGIIRLVMMSLPANNWGAAVPPEPFGIYRNIPLMIQGIGAMGLILYDAYRTKDKPFIWIGWMIAVSYLFYTPVILFAQIVPMLGMLMIPKTLAYLAIAVIAYKWLWVKNEANIRITKPELS